MHSIVNQSYLLSQRTIFSCTQCLRNPVPHICHGMHLQRATLTCSSSNPPTSERRTSRCILHLQVELTWNIHHTARKQQININGNTFNLNNNNLGIIYGFCWLHLTVIIKSQVKNLISLLENYVELLVRTLSLKTTSCELLESPTKQKASALVFPASLIRKELFIKE